MRFRHVAILLILLSGAPLHAGEGHSDPIRESVSRTLALFEKIAPEWKVPCVSCHHQSLTLMTFESARRHGFAVNEPAVHAHAARTLGQLNSLDFALTAPVDNFGFGYGLLAAHAEHVEPNLLTALVARKMANSQRPSGDWPGNDGRPPAAYSPFTTTALAARVLSLYLPPQLAAERELRFRLARKWLLTTRPHSTEDRTFRLLGLAWTGASKDERAEAIAALLWGQHLDGGWSQVPGIASDAYSTGQALVALRQTGVIAADHPAFQRGARFLLETQQPDGSWHVKTRLHSPADISPPYFETGFPYGKDQVISCSATAWAAMALLEALPEVPDPARPLPLTGIRAGGAQPWMEIAIFGSLQDLKTLLAAGLNPEAATAGGATLLMLVAPDAAKMRLVLDAGAKINAQSKSGQTALSMAAGYRGSAAAVRLLIQRGAVVTPPEADPRQTALFAAAAAGDPEVVSLLLRNGALAQPKVEGATGLDTTPLGIAAQNDHVEVVRLLAKNGADVNRQDDAKMTLLIWAALMHRTGMVRALLELGADPAAVDKFGYNALRHTGDIAYADPTTVNPLMPLLTYLLQ